MEQVGASDVYETVSDASAEVTTERGLETNPNVAYSGGQAFEMNPNTAYGEIQPSEAVLTSTVAYATLRPSNVLNNTAISPNVSYNVVKNDQKSSTSTIFERISSKKILLIIAVTVLVTYALLCTIAFAVAFSQISELQSRVAELENRSFNYTMTVGT